MPGASLGEVAEAAEDTAKAEAPCISTATVEDITCDIREVSLCSVLLLPDAMSTGRRFEPPQGHLILYVRGKYLNRGKEHASVELPKFISVEHKHYDGKELYIRGQEAKSFFFSLNPDEAYEFACYYLLPIRSIANGKLNFRKNTLTSRRSANLELYLSFATRIHDILIRKGITDNPFDVDEDNIF